MKKDKYYLMLGIIIVLAFWQISAVVVNRRMLPAPLDVFITLYEIRKILLAHLWHSCVRVFSSIFISILIGLPLGILAGYYRSFDRIFSPAVFCLYPIPKIVFLPIAMLFLGLGNGSKILIMILIIVFQIIVIVRDGVRKIPNEYFHQYLVAKAGFITICRRIIVPAVAFDLLTALRGGFATAISVLFFSESYGTSYGVGYFILDSWMRMNYRQMYAGIVSLAVLGIAFYTLVDLLQMLIEH